MGLGTPSSVCDKCILKHMYGPRRTSTGCSGTVPVEWAVLQQCRPAVRGWGGQLAEHGEAGREWNGAGGVEQAVASTIGSNILFQAGQPDSLLQSPPAQ